MFLGQVLFLANAGEGDPADFVGLANELQIDNEGWAVVPYGESRHDGKDGMKPGVASRFPKGVIQRFTREDAQAIVDDFKSTWSRIKRAVVGLPIFKGHPDAPAFANIFPDKMPRGTIADMEAGDQGLRLKFVLTSQGADDVEAGFNQFSPFWPSRVIGLANDGATIVAPFRLISAGIVRKGNIPGLSLVNAQIESTMKNNLIKLLGLLGVTIAADASDDAVIAAANSAETTVTALKQAKTDLVAANAAKTDLETKNATLETEKATLTTAKTTLEGEKVTLANAKSELETKLAAERKGRATVVIDGAVKTGRIAAADRDAQITALANAADFAAEAAKVEALKPKLKTDSALGTLGKDGKEQQSRQGTILSLVNAKMETPEFKAMPEHERYDKAFAAVMADPANAGTVGAMKKPEAVAS